LRLLVVDDNEDIIEAISVYCGASEEVHCQVIKDGKEGLQAIRNEKYDLILLDLAIPGFSGWDIIRSLNEDGDLESKNIVIFTASSDPSIVDEMRNMGIKEIFKKPCSLHELTSLIMKYRPTT
jgi:DNA-binding response OmpR family regulator